MFTIILSTVIIACKDSSTEPVKTIPFETVSTGINLNKDTTLIIKDSVTWINLCNNYWTGSKPPMPQIDFQKDQIVAIFYPAQSGCTGNLDLINKIEVYNNTVNIYRKKFSALMMGQCDGWFYPRQIIKYQRQELTVEFVVTQ